MFYLRTSSLRHKIMQVNFESGSARVGSDWESSRFRITARDANNFFGKID